MPKLEIETKGMIGKIRIDGVEVPGIRGYSLIHKAGGLPVLQLDFAATELAVDGDQFVPALPEALQPFYQPVNEDL